MLRNIFKFGRRTVVDHKVVWEDIDLNYYKLEKPVIFVFGGNATKSDQASAGNIKIVESFIRNFIPDVDIIGVNYSDYGLKPDYFELNCDEFADDFLVPLFLNHRGKKIDIEKAKKIARNFTLFMHCKGTTVVRKILSRFQSQLERAKYSQEDIDQIMAQFFAVTYAEYDITDSVAEFKSMPMVRALGLNDQLLKSMPSYCWKQLYDNFDNTAISKRDRTRLEQLLDEKKKYVDSAKVFAELRNRCYVVQQDNKIRLISTYLTSEPIFENVREDEHNLSQVRRNREWKVEGGISKAGDYLSRCLACALCYSVANSILNRKNKNFIPIDVTSLRLDMENFVKNINHPDVEEEKGE